MKMRNVMKMFVTVFASALLLTSSLAFAEATLPEVSQAIQSGQLAKADAMMKEVLQNHPNSAKAHYIASELYLREGKIDAARQAFIQAENLAPGLPFAQRESVQRLQAELRAGTVPANTNTGASSIFTSPMFWILIAILIAGIIFFMKKRQPPVEVYNAPTANGPYPGAPGAPGVPGAYPPGYPGAPSAGSGLMGSLATGAALGAGMVAGEALASHLMGGSQQHANPGNMNNGFNQVGGVAPDAPNFGVNDTSSWDDAGASSWDDSGGGDFMSDV